MLYSRTIRYSLEGVRIVGRQHFGVYQVQERMNGDRFLFPICQFRLTLKGKMWHLYWMRKFDAWWPYPLPDAGRKFTLRARMQQVLEDRWGCFFG